MFFGFNGLAKRTGIGDQSPSLAICLKEKYYLFALLMVATRSHDHKASKMQLKKCFGFDD